MVFFLNRHVKSAMSKVSGATACAISSLLLGGAAYGADGIIGQVLGAGAPIVDSTVTLWAASAGNPQGLAQARTGADGRFSMSIPGTAGKGTSLYLVAQRGRPAASKTSEDNSRIALMTVVGATPPRTLVINEFTTIASVWTHNQFIDGTAIKGHALGLKIAAGNMPNLVNLETGGWGTAILDSNNSTQTPTMSHFATLADVIAACVVRVKPDACDSLLAAATPPTDKAPTDTLTALQAIARYPAHRPEKVFALVEQFYPVPAGKKLRAPPFMPYLVYPPSAWLIGLKFTGGGLNAPGKIMFDSDGNAWTGSNFIVGMQSADSFWNGTSAKFAPNGRPLSPNPGGFGGGGIEGPGFGTAIDASDRVWMNSTGGRTMSLFDKNGKPLSPADGFNFGGRIGVMQGVIVAPSGDVWALDFSDDKVVHLPKGDPTKVEFFCQSTDGRPNKDSPCKLSGPFHLAIDQQDRIWITNAVGDTVTRFPARDPTMVEVFPSGGHSGKGMAIDSQGNAWVTNTAGSGFSLETKLKMLDSKVTGRLAEIDRIAYDALSSNPGMGSVSMIRPDGTQAPGSPFNGGGSTWGSWGVVIDGNDQVWISNFRGRSITHLCGVRTETCPPGMKTGDPISPPGGYVGGGMQLLTDIGVDPAGNVWVADNWETPDACWNPGLSEATSTQCGGNGLTVFYGMAKPVRAPQIGPARPY
jgi:streptogramin lyase